MLTWRIVVGIFGKQCLELEARLTGSEPTVEIRGELFGAIPGVGCVEKHFVRITAVTDGNLKRMEVHVLT